MPLQSPQERIDCGGYDRSDSETAASRILSKQLYGPGWQFQGDRYCGLGNFDGPIELGGFFQVTICLAFR
jgi:hypothetical protein